MKIAMATVMANGLARTGFNSQLQGTLRTKTMPDSSTCLDSNYWLSGQSDILNFDTRASKD